MQGLTNLISGLAAGDATMMFAMVMVFVFVMLFGFGVYPLVTPYVAAGRRLDPEADRMARNSPSIRAVSIRFGQNDRRWMRWLGTLGQRVNKEPAARANCADSHCRHRQ